MSSVYYGPERNATSGANYRFPFPVVSIAKQVVLGGFEDRRVAVRHAVTVRSLIIGTSSPNLETAILEARRKLSQPQGAFAWLDDAGQVVLEFNVENDINLGPHPRGLQIERVYGSNVAIITWTLESETGADHNAARSLEDEFSPIGAAFVDLSYTVAHRVDHNGYSTRNINGVFRINRATSTKEAVECTPDAMREIVEANIPKVPAPWQRILREYNLSGNGLTLAFSFTDQQRAFALPPGCTSGDATVTVSNPQIAVRGYADIELAGYFEAPVTLPDAPYQAFVALATNYWDFNSAGFGIIVKGLSVTRHLYRNRIDFSMGWTISRPSDSSAIPGADGSGVQDESIANANLVILMSRRVNDWLNTYAEAVQTDAGPYGTSNIFGFGTCIEPVPAIVLPILPGNQSQDTVASESNAGPSSTPGDGVDEGNDTYAYSRWHQNFRYVYERNQAVIPYLTASEEEKSAFVTQLGNSQLFLTVTGEAARDFQDVAVPNPPYVGSSANPDHPATVLCADISKDNIQVGPRYTATWRYILHIDTATELAELQLPYSPISAAHYDEDATTFPAPTLE